VPSGGLVTTVSGGKLSDEVGAGAQETARKISRNAIGKYFILTPVCDYREDVLWFQIVPHSKNGQAKFSLPVCFN
jgi:hypothetical protein